MSVTDDRLVWCIKRMEEFVERIESCVEQILDKDKSPGCELPAAEKELLPPSTTYAKCVKCGGLTTTVAFSMNNKIEVRECLKCEHRQEHLR